ncbi:MAG: hypothetical protein Q9219_004366 [cf. Caloplaca sp. 3 TL-2023]
MPPPTPPHSFAHTRSLTPPSPPPQPPRLHIPPPADFAQTRPIYPSESRFSAPPAPPQRLPPPTPSPAFAQTRPIHAHSEPRDSTTIALPLAAPPSAPVQERERSASQSSLREDAGPVQEGERSASQSSLREDVAPVQERERERSASESSLCEDAAPVQERTRSTSQSSLREDVPPPRQRARSTSQPLLDEDESLILEQDDPRRERAYSAPSYFGIMTTGFSEEELATRRGRSRVNTRVVEWLKGLWYWRWGPALVDEDWL